VYAPAKYGIATESVPARSLVRANAWIEVSMVLSVIFGIAMGGALTGLSESSVPVTWLVRTQTFMPMMVILGVYAVSAVLLLGLQSMGKRGVIVPLTWHAVRLSTFWKSNQRLWRDPLGGVSLYVTTLYWGVGAVMQFAVLVWAKNSLDMPLKAAAYLQALVALGVIAGAYMAGRSFKLHSARQALPWGLLLAVLMPVMVTISNIWIALPLLLAVGVSGGMLLVPMNALLQHRGMQVLSSGRSIAVQGFNENLFVLLMLSAYSALLAFDVPLTYIMLLLSVLLIGGIAPLCLLLWRQFR
jgi:hypothetical protein